jgi:hypothetical protein
VGTIVKLSEALTKNIRLMCDQCPGYQPAYVRNMIAEHGEDAELKDALKTAPCRFCKKVGELKVEREGFHRSFRRRPKRPDLDIKFWSALLDYLKSVGRRF